MSKVYITASVKIDTNLMDKDIVNKVMEQIKEGPEITGGLKNAEIFVNQMPGFNYKGTIDCESCPYKDTLIMGPDEAGGGVICESPEGFKCPTSDFQTVLLITIDGELENRTRKETLKEYRKFVNYLKRTRKGCGFTIIHKSCHIMEIG